MSKPISKTLFITMLAAQAVIIGLFERLIPAPFAFAPGAKLGLGNLVTLIALFSLPPRDSFKVIMLRLGVTTLLAGGFSSFLYAFSGTIISYLGMLTAKKLGPKRVSLIGISTLGGMLHNLGQLLVFSAIARSLAPLNYLPILAFSGILSGFLVGLAGHFLLEKITPLRRFDPGLGKEWLSHASKPTV